LSIDLFALFHNVGGIFLAVFLCQNLFHRAFEHRADCYLLNPRTLYECVGDVPNVVFPCSALTDPETGRIAIYYGGADTVVALAFCEVGEITDFIKKNDIYK